MINKRSRFLAIPLFVCQETGQEEARYERECGPEDTLQAAV